MATQWPPRSPHEALLSTPGGRERLRRMADRTSPSPSPSPSKLRTARSTSALAARLGTPGTGGVGEDDWDDEEDDEETLQLKLQAIQARLKLKKLQNANAQKRAAAAQSSDNGATATRPESAPVGASGLREVPIQSRLAAVRERLDRAQSQNGIQVPASPVRKAQSTANLQTSPQRIVLGIDKGMKASDMSLKRAPSIRRAQDQQQNNQGPYLHRSRTPGVEQIRQEAPRPLSFSERLASARTEEEVRLEHRQKVQELRSDAFAISREEMEEFKSKAEKLPDLPSKPEEFNREQIIAASNPSIGGGGLHRSKTLPSIRSKAMEMGTPSGSSAADSNQINVSEPDLAFDPYSGFHLSRRILPHKVLTRTVSGKKIYVLKDLLRHVKAPDWSLPDDETDIVVFAIIATKSDPRNHKPTIGPDGKEKQDDRGKYMVITLVDLEYEIELFLFNTGFERFWKLSTGTVVAILNPTIMPPPPGRKDTGRFSIVINSDEDTILEVGTARDLGFCSSMRADGSLCKAWVNIKRTEHCEFHINVALQKTRATRTDVNSGSGFGDGSSGSGGQRRRGGGSGGGSGYNSWGRAGAQRQAQEDERKAQGARYDRATQSRYYVSTAAHGVALLDDQREGGVADRAERASALKRRMAARERERDIAKQLGELGRGAGRDYLGRSSAALGSSVSSASGASSSTAGPSSQNTSLSSGTAGGGEPRKVDAKSLGLLLPKGEGPKISLAPVKRKRPESAQSTSTTGTGGGGSGSLGRKAALGWGSGLTDKLSRMRDGEKLNLLTTVPPISEEVFGAPAAAAATRTGAASGGGGGGDRSPVRKKTRFVTEKGIREAGRESLGEQLSAAASARARRQALLDDDDDDDLVILK